MRARALFASPPFPPLYPPPLAGEGREGARGAERRKAHQPCAVPAKHGGASCDAPAFRRSTLRLLPSGRWPLGRNSRPGFLGRGRSARSCKPAPTGGRRPCAAKRALPAPACPSPGKAPPGPVVVPVSMMPEAARERSANPARGHRARSTFRLASRKRPSMSEIRCM